MLLQTILWPPIVEGGHHVSDRWKRVRNDYFDRHPHARCRVCGCQGEKTWHLFSVQRRGWSWRIIAARSTVKKLHLHELSYVYVRNHRPVPDRWLMPLCPTHHTKLHRFDKRLFPWDRRNRLLWLTTVLYVYVRWWGLYALVLGGPFAWLWVR